MEYPDRYAQPQDHLPPAKSITDRKVPDMIVLDTTEPDVDRIAVFEIDGTVYTMPGDLSATVTLEVLDHVAQHGEIESLPMVLRKVLGGKAYNALLAVPHLKGKQLEQIFGIVMAEISSGLSDSSGN